MVYLDLRHATAGKFMLINLMEKVANVIGNREHILTQQLLLKQNVVAQGTMVAILCSLMTPI